jgi:hypothetical protein
MTDPASLTPATSDEITRVLGDNSSATVYLLGGTGSLSQSVEDSVDSMGYQVVRLQGSDRFATSIAVANAINPHPNLVLAATGDNFPDGLSAGAAAGSFDVPGSGSDLSAVVILTNDSSLSTVTKEYLDGQVADAASASRDLNVFGIGGQAANATVGYGSISVAGDNRYATSAAVEREFFGGEHYAGLATGSNWPDALAGGAVMATLGGPLLLAEPNGLDSTVSGVLDTESASISCGLVFGGDGVVSDPPYSALGTLITGPEGDIPVVFSGSRTQPVPAAGRTPRMYGVHSPALNEPSLASRR